MNEKQVTLVDGALINVSNIDYVGPVDIEREFHSGERLTINCNYVIVMKSGSKVVCKILTCNGSFGEDKKKLDQDRANLVNHILTVK